MSKKRHPSRRRRFPESMHITVTLEEKQEDFDQMRELQDKARLAEERFTGLAAYLTARFKTCIICHTTASWHAYQRGHRDLAERWVCSQPCLEKLCEGLGIRAEDMHLVMLLTEIPQDEVRKLIDHNRPNQVKATLEQVWVRLFKIIMTMPRDKEWIPTTDWTEKVREIATEGLILTDAWKCHDKNGILAEMERK